MCCSGMYRKEAGGWFSGGGVWGGVPCKARTFFLLFFFNLQGPKLFTGTPSLFCIVGSVLRSDLESVLTGNQQFLRWSNSPLLWWRTIELTGEVWGGGGGEGGRERKDDNRFPFSFPSHVFFPFPPSRCSRLCLSSSFQPQNRRFKYVSGNARLRLSAGGTRCFLKYKMFHGTTCTTCLCEKLPAQTIPTPITTAFVTCPLKPEPSTAPTVFRVCRQKIADAIFSPSPSATSPEARTTGFSSGLLTFS